MDFYLPQDEFNKKKRHLCDYFTLFQALKKRPWHTFVYIITSSINQLLDQEAKSRRPKHPSKRDQQPSEGREREFSIINYEKNVF